MNELLISEIKSEDKNLLQKIVLIEEFIFSTKNTCLDSLDSIIESCKLACCDENDPLEQAEELINELYIGQLLLDKYQPFWHVNAYQIQYSLDYRIIAPTLKTIFLRHIIEECGFDCDVIFVPDKIMVRIVCDDMYAIIFDPVTGESLNWDELDIRMDETEDITQEQPVEMSHISLITKYLSSLKNELIREQSFDNALKCVDILLALRPDDPFERRDRGFLLHQLDCFKVAVDDYRYFVQHCPKDPAAQLLKLQLDSISIADTILH